MDEKNMLNDFFNRENRIKEKKIFFFVMNTKLSISNELSPLIIES